MVTWTHGWHHTLWTPWGVGGRKLTLEPNIVVLGLVANKNLVRQEWYPQRIVDNLSDAERVLVSSSDAHRQAGQPVSGIRCERGSTMPRGGSVLPGRQVGFSGHRLGKRGCDAIDAGVEVHLREGPQARPRLQAKLLNKGKWKEGVVRAQHPLSPRAI